MKGRQLLSLFAAGIVIVLAVSSITQAKQNNKPIEDVQWTIAIYACADNDLESYWEGASLAMLMNLPSTDSVSFVGYVDLMSTEGTTIVEVDGGEWSTIESLPEMNFADGATFQWFLSDLADRYPADNLAVILWDHGSAWNGFCGDYTSGDWMYLDELQSALVGAGVHVDIMGFDACAMSSIETTYSVALSGLVDLVVASEELVAGDGFPYDLMFAPLVDDPTKTPLEVSHDMIVGWEQYYTEIGWGWYATLGVVDVAAVAASIDEISAWSTEMLRGLRAYSQEYRLALRDCSWVSCISHYQVDLADLGRHLLLSPAIAEDTALADATADMVASIEACVLEVYNPDRKEDCGGLSIYWGFHNWEWRWYWETYTSNVPFALATGWGDFIYEYNALTCGWFPLK